MVDLGPGVNHVQAGKGLSIPDSDDVVQRSAQESL